MRIILTGGGTAGHVNPAIAIAEILKKNIRDAEIIFVGTPNGMERRLIGEVGYPYYPIRSSGFTRGLSPKNLKALWIALTSPQKAKRLLLALKPDLVVGTGGYVSWPVLSAAASLGIPCACHESNATPGLTVRRLARRVDTVMLNFMEAANELRGARRIVEVGNPLRGGFRSENRKEARRALSVPDDGLLVVSFGGSLGAEAINRAVLDLFEKYTLHNDKIYHIHGCGKRYFEAFQEELGKRFPRLPDRIRYHEYLSDMPTLMAASDLLICRAGAITVSEIAKCGRASILIPSPNVANDHQTKNAAAMERAGAALLLRETDLAQLPANVDLILSKEEKRKEMEKAAAAFHTIDAERAVYRELLRLLGDNRTAKKGQT